jgi:tripartite-type tricarboxylate transporter receptor subunit TctC
MIQETGRPAGLAPARVALVLAILLPATFNAMPAVAADTAEFYKGRNVTLGVPNSAGGGYDVYTRALARHIGRHIPGNPNIIVQNVPAAGGMVLANQLYTTAPKDGSYFGMIRGTVVHEQVFRSPQVQFDARRFLWVGNMNIDYDACLVGAASPVKTVGDFYKHETAVGASGAGAQSFTFPQVYRTLLGMKMKVIAGYPGTPERMIALERGEIDGFCGITLSTFQSQLGDQAARGKVRLIAQASLRKNAHYPDLPNILDQAKTPDVRQALEFLFTPLGLGRAFAAPPDTPKDRIEALRQAMARTMQDPEFLADAKKLHIDIEPMDADETTKTANRIFETPEAAVARIKSTIAR